MPYNLAQIAALEYRWGDLQAIAYDPVRESLFPPPYLTTLYNLCRASGRARLGILENLFCGMMDLSHDAITAYLHSRKLVVLGEWRTNQPESDGSHFHPLGFCFLSIESMGVNSRTGWGAYAFFSEAWRTDKQIVLTMLGITYLFHEFKLKHLHGARYSDNHLTARWMRKFGFVDIGTIPDYLKRPPAGELTDATLSTVSRDTFENLLSSMLQRGEEINGALRSDLQAD